MLVTSGELWQVDYAMCMMPVPMINSSHIYSMSLYKCRMWIQIAQMSQIIQKYLRGARHVFDGVNIRHSMSWLEEH